MEHESSDESEDGQNQDPTETIETGLVDNLEQLEEHVDGSMGVSVFQMLHDSWLF